MQVLTIEQSAEVSGGLGPITAVRVAFTFGFTLGTALNNTFDLSGKLVDFLTD